MLFSSAIGIWIVLVAGCLAEDSTGNVVQSNVHAEHEEVYLDASPAINQGDRVGLRYVWLGRSWLAGWPAKHVQKATCPGVYFSGSKTKHCHGEIFQIFGQQRGPIKVGDKVALYYPAGKKWLGCNGPHCLLAPCPGRPTYECGFQDLWRWHGCWGEVFKIAVMNKKIGEVVQHKDPVMLYYLHKSRYVGGNNRYIVTAPCPGPFPPPASKWEPCWGEVFEIHLLKGW